MKNENTGPSGHPGLILAVLASSFGEPGSSRDEIPASAAKDRMDADSGRSVIDADYERAPSSENGALGDQAKPQAGAFRFGGFWIRVVAFFIDGLVLVIPLMLVSAVLHFMVMPADRSELILVEVLDMLFSIATWWLYAALLHSSQWQATVGKKALGLKVVDQNGSRISFARATGRHFAEYLSSLIFGIGYLMVAFTQQKQGLHDKIASTFVIRQELS